LTGPQPRSRRSAFSPQAALFRRTPAFRAHFGQGRKVWTPPDILAFAAETGPGRQQAAAVLTDRRYRSQAENGQRQAQQIGAHGTPFPVIDARHTVPGAICTDDLRRPGQSRPDQPVLRDAQKRWSRMGCGSGGSGATALTGDRNAAWRRCGS
jgi:hypothetical protein